MSLAEIERPSRLVTDEINDLIARLIESGLADDENVAYERRTGASTWNVDIAGVDSYGSSLKNVPYGDLYATLTQERSFNIKMLDGALIQLVYSFDSNSLIRYRLAYFPSPDLLEFQNNPGLYLSERIFADVVSKATVTIPLRFDYDHRPGMSRNVAHPVSHLTLGQYAECRIPVSAGMSPSGFMSFLLRSFYSLGSAQAQVEFPEITRLFPSVITEAERNLVHITAPAAR